MGYAGHSTPAAYIVITLSAGTVAAPGIRGIRDVSLRACETASDNRRTRASASGSTHLRLYTTCDSVHAQRLPLLAESTVPNTRLRAMASGAMKEELKAWVGQRLNALVQLKAQADAPKDEL